MLTKGQTKCPLIFMFVLTFFAWVTAAASGAMIYLLGYLGLFMTASTTILCSTYLTIKVQANNTMIFTAVFIGSAFSFLSGLVNWIVILILLVQRSKLSDNEETKFPNFTYRIAILLYICYSSSLLGILVPCGYFATLILEKGIQCIGQILFDWILIGGLATLALILFLVLWIYSICFIYKNSEILSNDKISQINIPAEQKSQDYQKKLNMQQLLEKMIDQNKKKVQQTLKDQRVEEMKLKEDKKALQQLLLVKADEEDQMTQNDHKQKQKLIAMTYEEYRKNFIAQQSKKQAQQQKLNHPQIRIQKAKINNKKKKEQNKTQNYNQKIVQQVFIALSPNDPNFNQIFNRQSDEENQNDNQLAKTQSVTPQPEKEEPKVKQYPANYVPETETDRKQYEQWKKQQNIKKKLELLQKRHPQNIEGGRSRRLLKKIAYKNKRPERNEQTYRNLNLKQQNQQQPQFYSEDEPVVQIIPQKPKQEEKPKKKKKKIVQNKPEPEQLYFHQSKVQVIKKQDRLFQKQQSFFSNNSILSSFAQKIPQERESDPKKVIFKKNLGTPKARKTDKLLEYIRSKYVV